MVVPDLRMRISKGKKMVNPRDTHLWSPDCSWRVGLQRAPQCPCSVLKQAAGGGGGNSSDKCWAGGAERTRCFSGKHRTDEGAVVTSLRLTQQTARPSDLVLESPRRCGSFCRRCLLVFYPPPPPSGTAEWKQQPRERSGCRRPGKAARCPWPQHPMMRTLLWGLATGWTRQTWVILSRFSSSPVTLVGLCVFLFRCEQKVLLLIPAA